MSKVEKRAAIPEAGHQNPGSERMSAEANPKSPPEDIPNEPLMRLAMALAQALQRGNTPED